MEEEIITASINKIVDAGNLAGAVTLVCQGGKVIQSTAGGWRDIESKLPMERNTIGEYPLTSRVGVKWGYGKEISKNQQGRKETGGSLD